MNNVKGNIPDNSRRFNSQCKFKYGDNQNKGKEYNIMNVRGLGTYKLSAPITSENKIRDTQLLFH